MMFSPLYQPAIRAFPADYGAARQAFLQALSEHAWPYQHEAIVYPATGIEDESLFTDVVWLGPAEAENVLILISATHGVEGFAGSAIQTDTLWQLRHTPLPSNLAIAMIHALNPWGFAWQRRVNEHGVDLNRNCVDFSQSLPANPDYALLTPDLRAPEASWSAQRWQQAVAGGQYIDSTGLFYGGSAPAFARQLSERLVAQWQLQQRQVVVLDLHTGLGPFGHGELICDHPAGSVASRKAKDWFGPLVTVPEVEVSCSVPLVGLMDYLWHHAMRADGMYLTLEYGTYSFQRMIEVLRADHALYAQTPRPDLHDPKVKKIRADLREFFNPASDLWQECVLLRARQVLRMAWNQLQGIAS